MTLEQAIAIIQRAEEKYVSAITYCTAMKVCMEHGYETVEEILALNAKNTSTYLVEVQDDKTGDQL